ncbi:hypothetical protein IE81DRAFT_367329 [Ceraceosorus guamensis]|uniref:Uncharacterized protein n=1 Tax=Ceraceosorus guamensis TaxID=1522189 RepID=A0A316VYZ3_9BASI|nr:hypothetical protein IE81DRAFT_367329 [Ceraceosorus guamensis]PWN41613.1 hypothetical protein IE81DRAFT_367329 [Ceraceosorus guamensis]
MSTAESQQRELIRSRRGDIPALLHRIFDRNPIMDVNANGPLPDTITYAQHRRDMAEFSRPASPEERAQRLEEKRILDARLARLRGNVGGAQSGSGGAGPSGGSQVGGAGGGSGVAGTSGGSA